jgi:hypothetical protein
MWNLAVCARIYIYYKLPSIFKQEFKMGLKVVSIVKELEFTK